MNPVLTWTLLSLRIAIAATALAAAGAVPLAYLLAKRRARWLSVIETLLTLPLVLPPTVVGYLLIVALGHTKSIANYFLGHSLLFTEPAAVLAAMVVIVPLIYLPAKAAFAAVDPDLEDAARLSGAGRFELFWLVSLPLARRGVAAGLIMAFARALGEFGATIMVLGIRTDHSTLPIAIWNDYAAGEANHAWPAIGILLVVSLIAVVIYNRVSR